MYHAKPYWYVCNRCLFTLTQELLYVTTGDKGPRSSQEKWGQAPLLGSLRKPRRQRQRERRETKGLMSRTIAVHVRYNSLYISLPSSTKQQREMTNSALSEERELRRLIF